MYKTYGNFIYSMRFKVIDKTIWYVKTNNKRNINAYPLYAYTFMNTVKCVTVFY